MDTVVVSLTELPASQIATPLSTQPMEGQLKWKSYRIPVYKANRLRHLQPGTQYSFVIKAHSAHGTSYQYTTVVTTGNANLVEQRHCLSRYPVCFECVTNYMIK